MTTNEMEDFLEAHEDEFLEFDQIPPERRLGTERADLHAFLMLDRLVPVKDGKRRDIIGDSQHDEIWMSIEPEDLAEVVTEEQLLDLHRCGIRYDSNNDSICMFT